MSRPPARKRRQLEQVIARGNSTWMLPSYRRGKMSRRQFVRDHRYRVIACRDGFRMSVVAGLCTDSTPEVTPWTRAEIRDMPAAQVHTMLLLGWVPLDYPGPYTHLEVGMHFPHRPPASWRLERSNRPGRTLAVYGHVPAAVVRMLVALHGGETAHRARLARRERVRRALQRRDRRRKRRDKHGRQADA